MLAGACHLRFQPAFSEADADFRAGWRGGGFLDDLAGGRGDDGVAAEEDVQVVEEELPGGAHRGENRLPTRSAGRDFSQFAPRRGPASTATRGELPGYQYIYYSRSTDLTRETQFCPPSERLWG